MSDAPTGNGGVNVPAVEAPNQPSKDGALDLKRKVKINGLEREMSVDEAYTRAQKSESAEQRFQEASKMRKEAEEIRGLMKSDVAKALEKEGFSKEQIKASFEDYLIKQMEEDSLTPEQKASKERDRKLKEYEDAAKERDESDRTAKEQAEHEKMVTSLETELIDALTESKLPKNAFLAKWVAQKMHGAYLNGYDMTAKDAVREVEGEFSVALSGVLSGAASDVRKLESLLGKEVVAAIRESGVAAVKNAEQPFAKPKQQAKQAVKPTSVAEEKKPTRDFFNELRGLKRR